MKIETVSFQEAEARGAALGKMFTPGSDEEFNAFEEKYLGAYDLIFEALGKVSSLNDGGGELSMSDGVEPHRIIGVVVMNKTALRPELLKAICTILNQIDDEYEDAKFAVQLQTDAPTSVYVLPGDKVLIMEGADKSDLVALGLR